MAEGFIARRGGGSGGSGKSQIIATAPTGSTVTAVCGSVTKTAAEKNGTWTFPGCDLGTWTVKAVLGTLTGYAKVVIAEEGHMFTYFVTISYQNQPADFDLASYGIKGVDYEVLRSDGTVIQETEYASTVDWMIELRISKALGVLKDAEIDVFCVGGGASGGRGGRGVEGSGWPADGGGGGFTKTEKNIYVKAGSHEIVIGAGGVCGTTQPFGQPGGQTSAFGVIAEGGRPGNSWGGVTQGNMSGGSNGGKTPGTGGDGNDGGSDGNPGQGTTTREFGEASGRLFAGGGGSGAFTGNLPGNGGERGGGNGGAGTAAGTAGTKNTGGGGGGGGGAANKAGGLGGTGGSGIVIIRPVREAA